MRAAFALRIFSGKIIYNFAILENLRIFQNCLFTGGVVEENGICSAAFYESAALRACLLPLGGAVAQRLRGYGWRSEKSVKAIAPTGAALAFCASTSSLGLSRACSPWRRVAAPSIRFVPWTALASCWPLPQQPLPVSAAGGGRSCCVAGWVESRGREGGVGTPLPASGPAERPCTLAASRKFSRSVAANTAVQPKKKKK